MKAQQFSLTSETVLNREYRILMPVGEGGFSITYLAESLSGGETVLVKELFNRLYMERFLPDPSVHVRDGSDTEKLMADKERFSREWQIMKSYETCPGMVRPIGFFEENGTAYIVMEHLSGGSLKDNIQKDGPCNADRLLSSLNNVLSLLDRMHMGGHIHGDISPDNLVKGKDGTYKLIDYGAVKKAGIPAQGEDPLRKEGYTPLEVYNPLCVPDPRSDIYSLCAVLYYALTGIGPVDAMERMISDLTPLSELRPDIDPLISGMVMKGLSMDINDRWNSMDEILSVMGQLGRSKEDREKEEKEKQRKKRKKRILFTLGAAALLAAGAALFGMTHRELIRFGGKETGKIVLFYDETMDRSDIKTLGKNIEKKVACIAGDRYLLKKGSSFYEITAEKEAFADLDLPSLVNEFFNFKKCAVGTVQSGTFLPLGEINSENFVSVEEETDGLYICLSEEFLDRIREGADEEALFGLKIYTAGCGNHMWDRGNTPYEGSTYTIEAEYKADEGKLFISDQALGGEAARRLFAQCLTQETIPVTSFNYSREIIWEQKQDTTWGANQADASQLTGETVLLDYLYPNPTDYDVNMLNIQVSEEEAEYNTDVIYLKKRLDAWGVPYACGWDAQNEFEMYIKVQKDAAWEIQAALLFCGLTNYTSDDICIRSLSGLSFPAEDTGESLVCDDGIVRVKVAGTDAGVSERIRALQEGIQLCLDGRPVLQSADPEISEDGWASFDTLILDNTKPDDKSFLPGFINYARLIMEEGPLTEYVLTGAHFYDSKGRIRWDKDIWDLPGCEQTSLREGLKDHFSGTGLDVDWRPYNPGSVSVIGLYSKDLQEKYSHPYAIAEELLQSLDLTNEIEELSFNIIVPRSDSPRNTSYMYYQMDISRDPLTGACSVKWDPELWNHSSVSEDPEQEDRFIQSCIDESREYLSSSETFRSCFLKPALKNRIEKTVIDREDLSVKVSLQDTLPGQDYQFSLLIENRTSDDMSVEVDEASINHIMASLPYAGYNIRPHDESLFYLNLSEENLHFSPTETFKSAIFGFTVNGDRDRRFLAMLPDPEDVMQDMVKTDLPADAKLLLDDENYSIYGNGFGSYDELGLYREADLILVNKTGDPLRFSFENLGFGSEWDMLFDPEEAEVLPFSVLYKSLTYLDLSLSILNLEDEDLEYISVVLSVHDPADGSSLLESEEVHILR